jgi:ferric-dicitrate binding protein FerR (iron transport regulator)
MLAINGKKTVTVGTGQQLSVVLPDGSQAKLNSGTTISYNTFLWKLSPKVKLEGEGYFYGKHTKGFDVATKAGEVTVLGTRFNVYSRNDSAYTVSKG